MDVTIVTHVDQQTPFIERWGLKGRRWKMCQKTILHFTFSLSLYHGNNAAKKQSFTRFNVGIHPKAIIFPLRMGRAGQSSQDRLF